MLKRNFTWLLTAALLASGCANSPSPQTQSPPASPTAIQTIETDACKTAITPEAPATPKKPASDAVNHEDNIYFALGATNVDQAGEKKLREHAARLKDDPKLLVTLIGLTDNSGSRSVNLLIAEQRVDAVAKRLRSYGVPSSQIRRYPLGSKTADESCNTAACRQIMRRVELSYPVTAR